MKQEDKELLLKDLCARLPYGVVIHFDEKTNQNDEYLYGIRENGGKLLINDSFYIEEIKPYLFPLSSMTEEQKIAYNMMSIDADWVSNPHYIVPAYRVLDWLNENHLDYRDLIGKGLALDATGKNIY